MPIYEYYCPNNHKIFSFYAKTTAQGGKTPRCPENPNYRMVKMLSGFSITGDAEKKEDTAESLDNIDEAKLNAALAEMEREMTGMDKENPDPRQMGRFMRKMADITGDKIPPSMEEMIGRLEAGEDPEKLEEELGGLLEEGFPEGDTPDGRESPMHKLRRKTRQPVRDPNLYDIAEYL